MHLDSCTINANGNVNFSNCKTNFVVVVVAQMLTEYQITRGSVSDRVCGIMCRLCRLDLCLSK